MRRGELVLVVLVFVTLCAIAFTISGKALAGTHRFPSNPTKQDVQRLVPDWRSFVALGRCEQPGPSKYRDGVQWGHSGPTWGGGLGIYRHTWYAAGSPYRLWSGNKWETILVADAIRDRFGITAWGAWRCFG